MVHLTRREYGLLAELARHPGRLLTRAMLLRAVWGPGSEGEGHYLHVHMSTLRRKLERDPARPRHLVTEVGIGTGSGSTSRRPSGRIPAPPGRDPDAAVPGRGDDLRGA